jgi:hypothetical protein
MFPIMFIPPVSTLIGAELMMKRLLLDMCLEQAVFYAP